MTRAAASEHRLLGNGLPLVSVALEGTRATTLLIAFAAGSRYESPAEAGVAHFLEHLVFQGGERYPDVRAINWTAERLGARMNAYTSAEVVAFHITVRAERLPEAAELLTDFLARPRLDPEELGRERGVVMQEIARSHDQPSSLADELIDRAAYGDHPLGRPILGTEQSLGTLSRDDVLGFRARHWAGPRGGAFLVGNLSGAQGGAIQRSLERLPDVRDATAAPPPPPEMTSEILVERRDSKQSHLRVGYRPTLELGSAAVRAALTIYTTLLGGSMGSRLVDEIRERRGLAYSVSAVDYTASDDVLLQLSAGLESANCVSAYRCMREIVEELATGGPTEEEMERVRAFAAGRKVLSFESTSAVARHAAQQRVLYDDEVDPDVEIARLDSVTREQVVEVARAVRGEPAVACVGPHERAEFDI